MYQYLALCIDKIAKYYTPANTIQLAIFTYCNFYADFCNENTRPCKYAQSLALCFKNTLNLSFKVADKLTAGKDTIVTFSFTNPLDVPLTNCQLSFEGSGAIWPVNERVEDVPANGELKHVVTVNPRRQRWGASARTLVAVFSSKEMSNVDGSVEVNIYNN